MNNITIIDDYEVKTADELGLIKDKDLKKFSLTYVEEGFDGYNYKVVIFKGKKPQCIIVPELMRCIGVCFHVKPKVNTNETGGMIGFHISPFIPNAKLKRRFQKQYYWLLKQLHESYDIPAIYVAGGRKNNEHNQSHYDVSVRSFVKPLAHIFPEIPIYQFATYENTQATMLGISKDKVSALRVGYDGRYLLSHLMSPLSVSATNG
jgi:hypothetical protein